jgi:hypothetical protein
MYLAGRKSRRNLRDCPNCPSFSFFPQFLDCPSSRGHTWSRGRNLGRKTGLRSPGFRQDTPAPQFCSAKSKRLFETVRHLDEPPIMLQTNPLQPPRPFTPAPPPAHGLTPGHRRFVAAEDFDATGIMAGVDLSEPQYWWMPELYGPEGAPARSACREPDAQATSRVASRTSAAA